MGVVHTAFAAAASFVFDAEASTADVVLRRIAAQSDTQILFPLERTRSIKANGVHGRYSVTEALEQALRGTGLTARMLDSGAIAVSFGADQAAPQGEQNVHKGFWATLLNVLALVPLAVSAQQPPAPGETLETVIVTGSLIKRNKDSSQLVTNIDAEELRQRGVSNAVDVLAAVAQNQLNSSPNDGARTGALTNLANLRSLGSENTLVLVNSKRMVNNPFFDNGVDLNTVPTALLESVDVLSDGASSIYGSDAVAGVINFRTREDFQGLQYNLSASEPAQKGGALRSASLAAGLSSLHSDGWNWVAGVTLRERTPITSVNRSFSATSLLPAHGINNLLNQPFPANIRQRGTVSGANPYPNCSPPATVPGGGRCLLDSDAAGLIDLQNLEKQKSAYTRLEALFGTQKLSVEYIRAESRVSNALTGTTIFGFDPYAVPPTSPYYPGNGIVPAVPGVNPTRPVMIDTRFTPGGRRTTENFTITDRVLAEFQGKLAGIDYDVWAMRSSSDASLNALNGALQYLGVIDGLQGRNGAAFINPFGPQSPAGAAYLQSIQYRGNLARGLGTLTMAGLSLSRSVIDLPGGPAAVALALESGRDTFEYALQPVNNLLEGAVAGRADPASGDRKRHSITAELLLPIARGVEVDASVRNDDYSDFGRTTTPKLLLSYDPVPSVNLHASFNRGFRAPPLPKLLAPFALGFVSGLNNDPVLCPGGVVNVAAGGVATRDCAAAFDSLSGGNPKLRPQESTAFAGGVSVRLPRGMLPMGTARFGIDYWHYKITNTIGTLPTAAIFGDPIRFAAYIVRCSAADPALRAKSFGCNTAIGTGDPIAYILENNANLGTTRTDGFDLTANWSGESAYGTFALGYRSTYVLKFDYQNQPGDPFRSRRGAYRDGYPVIAYSHFLTANWDKGQWGAALQNRFKSSYNDCNGPCFVTPQYFDRVSSYSLWRLVATYRFSEALELTLHVDNLFNTNPPFTNQSDGNCTGCDVRYADVTGRAFGLTVVGKLGFGRTR